MHVLPDSKLGHCALSVFLSIIGPVQCPVFIQWTLANRIYLFVVITYLHVNDFILNDLLSVVMVTSAEI